MYGLRFVGAAALMLSPVAFAQGSEATLGQKAKDWMVGNFDLTIEGVAVQDGHTYLKVQSSRDLDADGVPDEGVVRLECAGGKLRAAHYNVKSPRDSASGQASGKRTHHPVTFVKEWGPTTPQLYQAKFTSIEHPRITPKIAKESHGRFAASEWVPITFSDSATICVGREDARLESK